MTPPSLPGGRYLVAFNQVRTVAGGQTHALLQRTRFFAEHAGIDSTILTFDPFPDYAEIETDLRTRGKLHRDVGLLNIYHHYQDRDWDTAPGAPGDLPEEELPGLGALRRVEHAADRLWESTG